MTHNLVESPFEKLGQRVVGLKGIRLNHCAAPRNYSSSTPFSESYLPQRISRRSPQHIYRVLREMQSRNGKTSCVDLDGVLAYHETGWPVERIGRPMRSGVRLVRELKRNGFRVVVLTARPRRLHHSILKWLRKNRVPVDEVTNVKPPAEFYIDDKAVRWHKNMKESGVKGMKWGVRHPRYSGEPDDVYNLRTNALLARSHRNAMRSQWNRVKNDPRVEDREKLSIGEKYRSATDHYTNALNAYSRYFKESHLRENRKLHYKTNFQGLPISVENRKGSIRSGVDENSGEEWETKMTYPYGYIRKTIGVDGDQLDCFLGPDEDSENAYVVHANNPKTGEYDEDKVMLGFRDATHAKHAFQKNYDDPKYFGGLTTIPLEEFKSLAYSTKDRPRMLAERVRYIYKVMREVRNLVEYGVPGMRWGERKTTTRSKDHITTNARILSEDAVAFVVTPDGYIYNSHQHGFEHTVMARAAGFKNTNDLLEKGGVRIFNPRQNLFTPEGSKDFRFNTVEIGYPTQKNLDIVQQALPHLPGNKVQFEWRDKSVVGEYLNVASTKGEILRTLDKLRSTAQSPKSLMESFRESGISVLTRRGGGLIRSQHRCVSDFYSNLRELRRLEESGKKTSDYDRLRDLMQKYFETNHYILGDPNRVEPAPPDDDEPDTLRESAGFDEDKHPRDAKGRWSTSGESYRQVPSGKTEKYVPKSGPNKGKTMERPILKWIVEGTGKNPSPQVLARIEQIKREVGPIAPAWTEVRLNPDPSATRVVVGRDEKGRLQEVRSREGQAAADAAKFERLKSFNKAMPQLETAVQKGWKTDDRAAVVMVMMRTGLRVGGHETKGASYAYGASTLEARHVQVEGDKVRVNFIAKGGKQESHTYRDSELARLFSSRLKDRENRDRLFETDPARTREFIRNSTGNQDFKNHDVRTWFATARALQTIEGMRTPRTEREYKSSVKEVGKKVGRALGDTTSQALKSYIDPTVFKRWSDNLPKSDKKLKESVAVCVWQNIRSLKGLVLATRENKMPRVGVSDSLRSL